MVVSFRNADDVFVRFNTELKDDGQYASDYRYLGIQIAGGLIVLSEIRTYDKSTKQQVFRLAKAARAEGRYCSVERS